MVHATKRLKLQILLEEILGIENVYFQPPPNIQIKYPCIVYKRNYGITRFANNTPYLIGKRYNVVVIDRDPDSEIPGKIEELPLTLFDRFYTVNNLNHFSFNTYF